MSGGKKAPGWRDRAGGAGGTETALGTGRRFEIISIDSPGLRTGGRRGRRGGEGHQEGGAGRWQGEEEVAKESDFGVQDK